MNKHILLSIIFGLSLSAATPAQAAWYDWIPGVSWLRSPQAPAQPAQAAQPKGISEYQLKVVEVPNQQVVKTTWFSNLFSNPLAGFYTRFSAWWNKDIVRKQQKTETEQIISNLQLMAQERARQNIEHQQTINYLQETSQERAKKILELKENKEKETEDLKTKIAALTQQVTNLQNQQINGNNSPAEIETLKKREQELQKDLDIYKQLDQEKTKLISDAGKTLELQLKETKSLKTENDVLKATQQKTNAELEEEKKVTKKMASLSVITQNELQEQLNTEKKAQEVRNDAIKQSLNEFAQRFNTQILGFEKKATEKLNNLDQRVFKIATAVKAKQLVEPNHLNLSVTGDFLKIEKNPNNPQQSETEKGIDLIGQSLQMDKEFIDKQIIQGSAYARKILNSLEKEIPTSTQEEYLKSIVALNWFFYSHALENKQGFEEGTFVIEDKDFKFYNFFMDYIKKFNPAIKGDATDPLAHYSNNPYGYSRDASHFVHMKKKFRPYGIDMRLGNSSELPLLPAQKKHMLFGIVDPDKHHIYVKPENHGIYYADGLIGHIGEFALAQARKPTWVGSCAKGVLSYFGYDIGTDDDKNNRKERIPQQFLTEFTEAIKSDDNLKENHADLLKNAKVEGIKTLTKPELANSEKIQKLLAEYRNEYDNVENRYGREIHISRNNLLSLAGAQQ